MNDDNPYQGYANYETPRRSYSADDLGYPNKKGSLLRNPVVATVALLVGASILAGVIIMATPDQDDELVPVIKADNSPIKTAPSDPGGMAIPNRDSTLFDQMSGAETTSGSDIKPQVENLLAAAKDTAKQEIAKPVEETVKQAKTAVKDAQADLKAEAEKAVKDVENILQKAKDAVPQPSQADLASVPAKKGTPPSQYTKPEKLHPAGSSPETLAFVRSVLEQSSEDNTDNPAPAPSKTAIVPELPVKAAPEAPNAVSTATATPNAALTHFIQLSSIRDAARADDQWSKLQSQYSAQLSGAQHRVEKKDLGAKGIYYRIQAGPFTKADAAAKCDAIKSITPSGCYIVAK